MRAIGGLSVLVALLTVSCQEQGPTSASPLPGDVASESTALALAASHRLDESGEVDDPEDGGQCSRSPGFWCQNQDGGNPNLTSEELEGYVADALARLVAVGVSSTSEELLSGVFRSLTPSTAPRMRL